LVMTGRRLASVRSYPSSLTVTFPRRLTEQEYARAVLACQFALTLVELGELATVWPDGTAKDQEINALSDRWLASSPLSTAREN
jgi:hypothetical protein